MQILRPIRTSQPQTHRNKRLGRPNHKGINRLHKHGIKLIIRHRNSTRRALSTIKHRILLTTHHNGPLIRLNSTLTRVALNLRMASNTFSTLLNRTDVRLTTTTFRGHERLQDSSQIRTTRINTRQVRLLRHTRSIITITTTHVSKVPSGSFTLLLPIAISTTITLLRRIQIMKSLSISRRITIILRISTFQNHINHRRSTRQQLAQVNLRHNLSNLTLLQIRTTRRRHRALTARIINYRSLIRPLLYHTMLNRRSSTPITPVTLNPRILFRPTRRHNNLQIKLITHLLTPQTRTTRRLLLLYQ